MQNPTAKGNSLLEILLQGLNKKIKAGRGAIFTIPVTKYTTDEELILIAEELNKQNLVCLSGPCWSGRQLDPRFTAIQVMSEKFYLARARNQLQSESEAPFSWAALIIPILIIVGLCTIKSSLVIASGAFSLAVLTYLGCRRLVKSNKSTLKERQEALVLPEGLIDTRIPYSDWSMDWYSDFRPAQFQVG